MKRIIMVVGILLCGIFLAGCSRNYNSITYTKFTETFKNKNDYLVINQTLKYEDKFERCIEANGKNIQFIYYEFKTEKEARKYMKDNYSNRNKYSYKDRKKYITVKCTDNMYFYVIQIDSTIIVGNSSVKNNRKEIKHIFKELGY